MASLSVDDLGGGRFKLRWRELVADESGRPTRGADGRLVRRARSLTVVGKDARDEAVGRIRRALLDEGTYEVPAVVEETVANLEQAALAWIAWKRTRCSTGSVRRYIQHMARFFAAVRSVRAIPLSAAVRADVLSRDLLTEVVGAWQAEGLSESFVYGVSRSALEMWRWASDDPVNYPGVPVPPREAKAVLPRPPVYVAPAAPTLAEADACLRHLPVDAVQSRRIGAFLRYTGLRIFQVNALRRRDLDLEARTLTITEGKSRAEKAERRVVPVSRHLIGEVRGWVEALPPDALLFSAWGVVGDERRASIRPEVFRAAWEEATRWDGVREVAWKPANRKIARPEHAFRAAFQAALRLAGVGDEVIDALVGHHGQGTRGRHYAGHETLLPRMRHAVDGLGPIDWRGPSDVGSVISLAKRAERVRGCRTTEPG
jgi:integrase